MAFVHIKACTHDIPKLQHRDGASDECGIDDHDLEEGRIGRVETIEMDAFNEQNGTNEFGVRRMRVAFHGERDCMVQGKS